MNLRLLFAAALAVLLAIPSVVAQDLPPPPHQGADGCIYVDGDHDGVDDADEQISCATQPVPPPPSTSSPPTVTVAAPADPVIQETDAGGKSFTITRESSSPFAGQMVDPLSSDTVVKFKLSGTATVEVDYKQPSPPAAGGVYSVTIPAGDDSVTVAIQPLSDTTHPEGDAGNNETVALDLQADSAYALDDAHKSATMKIKSIAAPAVSIAATDPEAAEGSASDTGNFRITRTGAVTGPLKVTVIPSGDTASLVTALDGNYTIPVGQRSLNITVQAKNDDVAADKSVHLAITACYAPCAAAYTFDGAPATVTLVDNDAPRVSVTVVDASAGEGTPANGGTFSVARTGATTSSLAVNVEVAADSTASSSDYTLGGVSSGVVTIAAGSTSATVTVTPADDALREGTERVNLTVKPGTGYSLATSATTATLSILDNDVPAVNVTASDATATEQGATAASFLLKRGAQDAASALTVAFQVSGTAASADYTLAPGAGGSFTPASGQGTVVFPANVREALVTLTAVEDTAAEGNETLRLTVKQATSDAQYGLGTPSFADVTLVDNDILDADADGIDDAKDNCLGLKNADQVDTDADKLGNACDADDDNDGLTDTDEATRKTNPLATDSDQDGRGDKSEVDAGTDPLDLRSPSFAPSGITVDTNGQGVVVGWTSPAGSLATRFLVFRASDPTLVGTVNANAGQTAYLFTDLTYPGGNHSYYVQPMLASQSGNAFNAAQAVQSEEASIGQCEAFTKDSDGDGLCDLRELDLGTDPQDTDTDHDGVTDQAEVDAGTDPLEAKGAKASSGTKFAGEAPFWVGLTLAVATAVCLVIGIGLARRKGA